MIISCPYCQTRYQVASEAIGSAGRKVQCANCRKAWQAMPEPEAPPQPQLSVVSRAGEDDKLFNEMAEEKLDEAFEEAESQASDPDNPVRRKAETIDGMMAAAAGKVDPKVLRQRQRAFSRRQDNLARALPLARIRRVFRLAGLGLLASSLTMGYLLRTDIVRAWPDLAGIYASLGMQVNVVGLEFRDMRTLRAMRIDGDVMLVSAKLYSVASQTVPVPQVIVNLINQDGETVYQWSVAPPAPDLAPGEVVDFQTQLSAPPENLAKVRLTFAHGRNLASQASNAISAPAPEPEAHEPAAPPDHSPAHSPEEHS